jgi:hypothetical protein
MTQASLAEVQLGAKYQPDGRPEAKPRERATGWRSQAAEEGCTQRSESACSRAEKEVQLSVHFDQASEHPTNWMKDPLRMLS